MGFGLVSYCTNLNNNFLIMKTVNTTVSPITVSRVYASDFQREGTLTAELKQTVKTTSMYDNRTDDGLNDSLFDGTQSQKYETNETRVYWSSVPEGSTVETVEEQLRKYPNACLYRILASTPIVSDSEQWGIDKGMTTLDAIAERQLVRYPANHAQAGEPVLWHGEKQYRRICFSLVAREDEDRRSL